MSRPLSGRMAQIGDSAFRPIYETWVPEVNAQGGIFVKEYNKKLPIELKIYDDKSDPGTMTRLTEKLILEDKVDFLWPACGTAFLFAQAPIADLFGIEYSGVSGIELPNKGINIVGIKSVPPDIKDLSTILKDAQATKADAF